MTKLLLSAQKSGQIIPKNGVFAPYHHIITLFNGSKLLKIAGKPAHMRSNNHNNKEGNTNNPHRFIIPETNKNTTYRENKTHIVMNIISVHDKRKTISTTNTITCLSVICINCTYCCLMFLAASHEATRARMPKNKLPTELFLLSDNGHQRVTTVPMGSPAITLRRLPYTSMLNTWMGSLLSRAITVAVMSITLRPRL